MPLAGEISIHAPHTGRDRPETHAPTPMKQFQSTRPIRGATIFSGSLAHFKDISIHAPHTGRDPAPGWRPPLRSYFNPRAPYGARLICYDLSIAVPTFNPRAPYGARHVVAWRNTGEFAAFQSTRPIRGATQPSSPPPFPDLISIHAPHTGRDLYRVRLRNGEPISIHAPHTGRDNNKLCKIYPSANFNPRAPYGARLAQRWERGT